MRRLSRNRRREVLQLLYDNMSIRATEWAARVHRLTITELVVDMGHACADAHGKRVRNLRCRYIQADEVWSYCGMKAKRVPEEWRGEYGVGDVYSFNSIDPETKLVPTWLVGQRDHATAVRFLTDLRRRPLLH